MCIRVCLLLIALGIARAAAAAAPAPMHTAWLARDGAPSNVTTITQSSDGWMWFASSAGLYRFDGASFEAVESIEGRKLLSTNVIAVAAYKDQLWVGYQFGGISVFEHGEVRHYDASDGLPPGAIFRISHDDSGSAWMSGTVGVAYLAGGRWHQVPPEDGPASRSLLVRAPNGTLWAESESALYQCATRERRCRPVLKIPDIRSVSHQPDGTLWISLADGRYQEYNAFDGSLRKVDIKGLLGVTNLTHMDHLGRLWIATEQFLHLVERRRVERTFNDAGGFSNVGVTAAFDDREGNVWFATLTGIDRMRRPRLTAVELPRPLGNPTVVAGDKGAVWISAELGLRTTILDIEGGRASVDLTHVTASYRQPDGVIWYGNESELLRFSAGKAQRWPWPADIRGNQMQSMTLGPQGELWVSVVRRGVHTFKDGVWTKRSGVGRLPASAAIVMLTDPRGRVWLGYPQGRLALVDAGAVRLFGLDDGLEVGNVLALSHRAGRLWVGGEKGLAYLDGEKFHGLAPDDARAFSGASGIVETASGELWSHGADGVSRIGADDLKAALAARAPAVRRRLFDHRDGLLGAAPQIRPLPSLIEAGDGRLWYATSSAVGWIDPAHLLRNPMAPVVTIRGLKAAGKQYPPGAGSVAALPAGTDTLQIDYTALSFTLPERVRFRYRLEGLDGAWQDAGTRRTAFYNSLGPGRYTFRVEAVNEDGAASPAQALMSFNIAPTTAQSPWFRGVLALLALAGLWWLHAYRVGRVARRTRILLEERVGERGRIARELHDTLLQSLQATILKVQATALSVPPENQALRRSIEATVGEAQQALAEGRDRIQGLRAVGGADFLHELELLGEEARTRYPLPRFELNSYGQPRLLNPGVDEELLAMAREAVLNACAHAGAAMVSLELHYTSGELRLVVRDDGAGIPAEIMRVSGRAGHWGMLGIQERGRKIGARTSIRSDPGLGAAWTIRLPAALAYARPPAPPRRRWPRRGPA